MLEEAPVFGRQHRLHEMIRQLVDRHGILVDDAAMADRVAVAIKEGDGEIVVVAPVFLRLLEGRLGQRQQNDHTGRAECHRFAGDLEAKLLQPPHTEAAEEDADLLPCLGEVIAGVPQGGIEPAVDLEEDVAL